MDKFKIPTTNANTKYTNPKYKPRGLTTKSTTSAPLNVLKKPGIPPISKPLKPAPLSLARQSVAVRKPVVTTTSVCEGNDWSHLPRYMWPTSNSRIRSENTTDEKSVLSGKLNKTAVYIRPDRNPAGYNGTTVRRFTILPKTMSARATIGRTAAELPKLLPKSKPKAKKRTPLATIGQKRISNPSRTTPKILSKEVAELQEQAKPLEGMNYCLEAASIPINLAKGDELDGSINTEYFRLPAIPRFHESPHIRATVLDLETASSIERDAALSLTKLSGEQVQVDYEVSNKENIPSFTTTPEKLNKEEEDKLSMPAPKGRVSPSNGSTSSADNDDSPTIFYTPRGKIGPPLHLEETPVTALSEILRRLNILD